MSKRRPLLVVGTAAAPAFLAPYLVNGDSSGLTADERAAADRFAASLHPAYVVATADEGESLGRWDGRTCMLVDYVTHREDHRAVFRGWFSRMRKARRDGTMPAGIVYGPTADQYRPGRDTWSAVFRKRLVFRALPYSPAGCDLTVPWSLDHVPTYRDMSPADVLGDLMDERVRLAGRVGGRLDRLRWRYAIYAARSPRLEPAAWRDRVSTRRLP